MPQRVDLGRDQDRNRGEGWEMKRFVRCALTMGIVAAAYLGFALPASAAPPTGILAGHGDIACTTQGAGEHEGQTWCGTGASSSGNVSSSPGVGGVPIDLNFALPATGEAPYPLVMVNHGNGEAKYNFTNAAMQRWLNKGYAVYSQTSRGFGYTCLLNPGDPGCEAGYSHMMDYRYEVRDAQNILGLLADEDLIQPKKIAATGASYGGAMSMSLAVLKNRVMNLDGSLHPWKSPAGKDLEIAVAAPLATWTDFNYAMFPNGNAVDYIKDAGYYGPTGIMKESYIQGLLPAGRYAPAGTDPQADVLGWTARLNAGEPYDNDPAVEASKAEVTTYHSSYGLPPTQAPAPLFIVQGFTDDIFPVDEATRFYNRSRAMFPDSPIGLFFASVGHPRGQGQSNVFSAYGAATADWIDHYLKGMGAAPPSNVTTYTQTCPGNPDAGGPYTSPDWASIAPGEIRVSGGGTVKTIDADGGDFAVSKAFNPLSSIFGTPPEGTACATAAGAEEPGSVNYETEPAPAGGYTVMGASTVILKVGVTGANSQIAARLVDISPDGTQKILVSRGLWRPDGSGFQVFQLFANGWKVEQGHVLRLELLPRDSGQAAPGGFFNNYARPSNGQQDVDVSYVDLRIPVLESPGSLGGLVTAPAPRVLPDRPGVELAKGNEEIGSISIAEYARLSNVGSLRLAGKPTVKGKQMRVRLTCDVKFSSCAKSSLSIRAKGKVRGTRKAMLARKSGINLNPGKTKTFSLKLTSAARKIFKDRKTRKRGKVKVIKGAKKVSATVHLNGSKAGFTTVRRVGRVR